MVLKENSAEKEQKIYHGEQNPFILQRQQRESFKIHLNCDRLPVIDEITGKTN